MDLVCKMITEIIVAENSKYQLDLSSFMDFDYLIILNKYSSITIIGKWNLDNSALHAKLRIHNRGIGSMSSCDLRTVLSHHSSTSFDVAVITDKIAIKSRATMRVNQLLLDDTCTAVTTPQLYIYQGDVQCKHSSLIDGISKEKMLYFQTRGVEVSNAQEFLAQSFLHD
jgi:Fe-S cluster assembly scaffold protein SufB